MSYEVWFAFIMASVVLSLLPGPTAMLVVSYALNRGRASGFATVPGAVLGDFIAMTISLAGAGAILAASATLFTILKLCGAAYLIYLGIRAILERAPLDLSRGRAPIAMRRPISPFRSVTVAIMMFMILMPPAIKDTEATSDKSQETVLLAPR